MTTGTTAPPATGPTATGPTATGPRQRHPDDGEIRNGDTSPGDGPASGAGAAATVTAAAAAATTAASAAALLFDARDPAAELRDLFGEQLVQVWRSLAAAGIGAEAIAGVVGELASEVADLATTDLLGSAVTAWTAWRTVREAAERSVAAPSAEPDRPEGGAPTPPAAPPTPPSGPTPARSETLVLGPHTLTSTHERVVELFVGPQPIATLPLALTLEFDFDRASLTLSAGRLTRLRPGAADVTVRLTVADVVVQEVTRPLPLPDTIPLGRGIPLARGRSDRRHSDRSQPHTDNPDDATDGDPRDRAATGGSGRAS
jgi:hypothetical protein